MAKTRVTPSFYYNLVAKAVKWMESGSGGEKRKKRGRYFQMTELLPERVIDGGCAFSDVSSGRFDKRIEN